MRIIDLINAQEGLDLLVKQKLPAKLSFKVKRAVEKVIKELKLYEATRLEVLNRLGTLDKEKNVYKFKTVEDRIQFNTELNDLLNSEIDIDIQKIKEEDIEKSDIQISPETLLSLSWLFLGEEEE